MILIFMIMICMILNLHDSNFRENSFPEIDFPYSQLAFLSMAKVLLFSWLFIAADNEKLKGFSSNPEKIVYNFLSFIKVWVDFNSYLMLLNFNISGNTFCWSAMRPAYKPIIELKGRKINKNYLTSFYFWLDINIKTLKLI